MRHTYTALLTAITLCFVALPAAAQEKLPDFLAGKTFTAVGVDADGNSWYSDFIFDAEGSGGKIISHDNADCEAKLIPEDITEKRVLFSEVMINPNAPCFNHVWVEIVDDPITMKAIATVSLLKGLRPVNSKAILFDKDNNPHNRERMQTLSQDYAGAEHTILGNWEYTKGNWLAASCADEMNREGKDWVPVGARGALTVWAVPTEDGGRIFAAWPGEMDRNFEVSKDVTFAELKHWNESSFVSETGIVKLEGRTFIGIHKKPDERTGGPSLYLAPDGGSTYDYEYLRRCEVK